jgi:hypothetical protein
MPEKKPGYAIRKTWDAFVNTQYQTLDWRHVSLMDVPLFLLWDALKVLAIILSSILFPALTCTLTVTMTMTCSNKPLPCATTIFATVLITINEHFQHYWLFLLFRLISLRHLALFDPTSIGWAAQGASDTRQANGHHRCTQQPTVRQMRTLSCETAWSTKNTYHVRDIGCKRTDWIHLTQDREQCRVLTNMVMNLRIP